MRSRSTNRGPRNAPGLASAPASGPTRTEPVRWLALLESALLPMLPLEAEHLAGEAPGYFLLSPVAARHQISLTGSL